MARYVFDVVTKQLQTLPDYPPEDLPVEVPKRVSMRQARHALNAAGLLSQVETFLNMLPEAEQTAAKIEWEYSTTLDRDNPVVLQLIPLLELTEQQVDQLFINAASL